LTVISRDLTGKSTAFPDVEMALLLL